MCTYCHQFFNLDNLNSLFSIISGRFFLSFRMIGTVFNISNFCVFFFVRFKRNRNVLYGLNKTVQNQGL